MATGNDDDGEPDVETLAQRIATTSHEALASSDVDAFDRFVDGMGTDLPRGEPAATAERLAVFWRRYLQAGLRQEGEPVPSAPQTLVENALDAGIVGIDLYEALRRFFDVREATGSGDGPTHEALENWTRRVLDLTDELRTHVLDHHR